MTPEKETTLLAIPETCADKIITLCHLSPFAGQQGVIKTYLTIGDDFFIPHLIYHLRSYIKGSHICPIIKKWKNPQDNYNIESICKRMSRLSMYLKSCQIHIKVIGLFYVNEVTFISLLYLYINQGQTK